MQRKGGTLFFNYEIAIKYLCTLYLVGLIEVKCLSHLEKTGTSGSWFRYFHCCEVVCFCSWEKNKLLQQCATLLRPQQASTLPSFNCLQSIHVILKVLQPVLPSDPALMTPFKRVFQEVFDSRVFYNMKLHIRSTKPL